MIIVEAPETLLLSYENLATEVTVAEAQKDILSQFLRSQYSDAVAIVEKSSRSDGNPSIEPAQKKLRGAQLQKRLVLKCIQCSRNAGEFLLDTNSIRVDRDGSADKFSSTFSVVSRTGGVEVWKVAVAPDDSGFCVRAEQSISPSRILSESDFKIEPCSKEQRNRNAAFFESRELARLRIENVVGFRLAQYVGGNTFLSVETLEQPIAVKAFESVKVFFNGGESPFQIKFSGKSLQSGAKGQRVKVELDAILNGARGTSKRVVDAVVSAPGEVVYVR